MRKMLFASAALLGFAALPALAQNAPAAAENQPGAMTAPGDQTGQPATQPMHRMHTQGAVAAHDSNITQADTRSMIAPALPTPSVGPDADAQQYLRAAQQALQRHRTGEAQEALERAETRLLDRATDPSRAGQPDDAPATREIRMALESLGHHDLQGANQHVSAALQSPSMAMGGAGTAMPSGAAGAAPAGSSPMMGSPGSAPSGPGGSDMMGSPSSAPASNGAPASGNMSQ